MWIRSEWQPRLAHIELHDNSGFFLGTFGGPVQKFELGS